MPRTGHRSSPALRIELEDAQPVYLTGDTVKGYVNCDESVKTSSPLPVRLKFFARAKSKYTVKTQHATSIHRGRAVFFEEQIILQKGSNYETGQHAWPFTFVIPTTSQPGFASRGDTFRRDREYLSTEDATGQLETDVTKHPLPSVMYFFSKSAMSGKTSEAYIEYVLSAEMGSIQASYPLYVRQRSSSSPITNYDLRSRSFNCTTKTLKLLPEYADKPLTFSQHSKSFFRPSKTPKYSYAVRVEYPTIIQLEHPDPIPLRIYLIPDFDEKKTSICTDRDINCLPDVSVVSVELKLASSVNIRCPGTFWDSDNDKNHTLPFQLPTLVQPIPIPVITEETVSQNSLPPSYQQIASVVNGYMNYQGTEVLLQSGQLDLGQKLSVLLGCSAASTLGRPPVSFKRQIYPTFSTYNINIKYRLKWSIRLSCAGEEEKISGEAPVTILAPSEEQEEKKARELGTEGMRKNYDDMEAGVGTAVQFIGAILQAVGG